MKSRVSLARALVYEGDLVLLDEPFAALDEALRKRLGERLKAEIKARGASAILVTHQTEDAALLADRILTL
jgi:ABC-type nitrate/sulfonate/bicarbonate transport system ATPase subunit